MELCTEGSLHHILDQPENGHGLSETDFLDVLHDVGTTEFPCVSITCDWVVFVLDVISIVHVRFKLYFQRLA